MQRENRLGQIHTDAANLGHGFSLEWLVGTFIVERLSLDGKVRVIR
jgi:hypothetical protein